MSKSTRGSLAWGERFDNFKLGLNDRDQNKLCQALTNGNLERFMASVPAGDLDLTLVVRINQTHQVAEYDPVLMPKTRAREDHCGQCGIFNMQGQSPRDSASTAHQGKPEGLAQQSPALRTLAMGCPVQVVGQES